MVQRNYKLALAALLLFVIPSLAFSESDSSRIVARIADSVESQRIEDSTDASDTFLLPFRQEIFICARVNNIPPALLAAIVQTESNFKQWATRTEPHYKKKKVVIASAKNWSKSHGGLPNFVTELDDRSRSYGLGQIMGQTAREQQFNAQYLSQLYDPLDNLSQVAIKVSRLIKYYKTDTLSAISAYNQGNNRMKNGRLENYRYVYKVGVCWNQYEKAFKKAKLINERQNFYHQTDGHSDTNRIRLGLSSGFFAWMQPPTIQDGIGFGQSFERKNDLGNKSIRFDTNTDRDTEDFFIAPGGSYPNKYLDIPSKGFTNYQWFITTGFAASLLGFCWLFFTRYVPDSAGYRFRLRRSTDARVRNTLKTKFKTNRDRRALYRPRFAGLPKGFYNHHSN
jgi:hypothetical protein